jgi:hypothetical protein
MYWFMFDIPLMPNGRKVTYPQFAWFGRMAKCPRQDSVTVHAYHDAEGKGIAYCTDSFIPPEVTVLAEDDALSTLTKWADDAAKVVTLDDRDPMIVKDLTPGELTADGRIAQIWIGKELTDRPVILKARDDRREILAEEAEAFKDSLVESPLNKPLGVG